METELWCAPHIHLAKVDDDIVVLDVTADRYSCLPDAASVIHLMAGGAMVTHESIADDLVRAGLAAPRPPQTPRPLPVSPHKEASTSPRPRRSDIMRASLCLITATLAFRGRAFASLVDPGRRPSILTARPSDVRLADLIGAARKARPWIPFEGECLQRAFLLRAFLANRGIAANWVFGVRTKPFAAHCWLQIGDTVVGDRLERVNLYTPIMVA